MSKKKWLSYLSGIILSVSLLSIGAGIVFLFLNRDTVTPPRWGFRGWQLYNGILWTLIGGLITKRKPKNPIGWLFLFSGTFAALLGALEEYAVHVVLVDPGVMPGGAVAAWFASWRWVPSMGLLMIHVLLIFPNGQLLSPKWRVVAWLGFAWIIAASLFIAFLPGPISNFPFVNNPFGLENFPTITSTDEIAFVHPIITAVILIGVSVLSLVIRFRKSSGKLRQQIKWVVYAGLFGPLTVIMGFVEGFFGDISLILFITFLAASFGIAILRYRLYDIDLVIRRTLSYSLLSILLAGVYFGSVIALQSIVAAIGDEQSPIITILSTLAIASLFNPLRVRVQDFIDRRFYRKNYDAEKALARFAATARDEVELERITNELLGVVEETMRPEHVSLRLLEERETK